jgi:hypothetical protein
MRVGIREIHFLFTRIRLFDGFVISLFLFSQVLVSCTNITNRVRAPSSILQTGGSGGTSSGAFQLVGIVTEPGNGALYNLIGQNAEFDVFCGGSYGTCMCEYTYTQSGLGVQTQETPVTYQESNLVRCLSGVPVGISSFTVKITVSGTNGSYESNALTASFGPGGTFLNIPTFIDVTDPMSYQAVQRYQCRKLEFIASPFDGTFLDPIQSQDPRVIYPFNFYTTNVGESLLALQINPTGSQGWDCTLTPTPDYSLHWWANPMVFSETPCTGPFCAGDGELMYPTSELSGDKIPVSTGSAATGKRRSTFSLLKKPYGVFQVPVIAATAPNTYVNSFFSGQSINAGLTLAPLGYAAAAVTGPGGTSSCPSIDIPLTARWVKLWSYRATNLNPPRRVVGTDASVFAPLACWPDHNAIGLFDSCSYNPDTNVSTATTASRSIAQLSSSQIFATRVALENGGGGGSANPSACYNILSANSNIFEPSTFGFTGGVMLTSKYWGRYASATTSSWNAMSIFGGTGGIKFAHQLPIRDPNLNGQLEDPVTPAQVNSVSGRSDPYSDYLFVVTDPAVSDSSMGSPLSVSHYRPVTYRTKGACSGTSRASCSDTDKIEWLINTKNVNDPNGAEVYPLCVLQFMD